MKIRWQNRSEDSPIFGLLFQGEEYDVPADNAKAWIASGAAEQVAREKKARREAAPESAVQE